MTTRATLWCLAKRVDEVEPWELSAMMILSQRIVLADSSMNCSHMAHAVGLFLGQPEDELIRAFYHAIG